jgi:hypothetical protein
MISRRRTLPKFESHDLERRFLDLRCVPDVVVREAQDDFEFRRATSMAGGSLPKLPSMHAQASSRLGKQSAFQGLRPVGRVPTFSRSPPQWHDRYWQEATEVIC